MTAPEQHDLPDRLAEIKQRAETDIAPPITSRQLSALVGLALVDRDWLIAEVERLRAALADRGPLIAPQQHWTPGGER